MAGLVLLGEQQTLRRLAGLPGKVQKKVLAKAARAGGNPFLKAARQGVPRGNRLLARSLMLVIRRYRTAVVAVIGQQKGKAFDPAKTKLRRRGGISGGGQAVPIHLVENAVRPHGILPKSAGPRARLRFQAGGRDVYARRVTHPGHRGAHFLASAARQAESACVRAFTEKAAAEINAEVGRS